MSRSCIFKPAAYLSNLMNVKTCNHIRRVDTPAVLLVKTSDLQLESDFKRSEFNSVSKSVIEEFEIERCRGHRTSADISCVLSWNAETKSLQVAYGVPYGFLDLVRWSQV